MRLREPMDSRRAYPSGSERAAADVVAPADLCRGGAVAARNLHLAGAAKPAPTARPAGAMIRYPTGGRGYPAQECPRRRVSEPAHDVQGWGLVSAQVAE